MNKALKLLAVLVFTGAALNACGGCQEEVKALPEEVKTVEEVEAAKNIDVKVVEETTEKTEVSE